VLFGMNSIEAKGVTVPMGKYQLGLNPFLLIIIVASGRVIYCWKIGVLRSSDVFLWRRKNIISVCLSLYGLRRFEPPISSFQWH
jgi:hypothetical protein